MLSLQAELLKKEQEFRAKKKAQSVNYDNIPRKKFKTSDKKDQSTSKTTNVIKNKGVEERNERDLAMSEEEVNKQMMSKSILEAKAKLYDKLTSGEVIPEQNENSPFLVDFEQKAVNSWRENGDKKSIKHICDTKSNERLKKDEMVEYEDALGRTRTCLKKDLHKYKKLDEDINNTNNQDNKTKESAEERTLMSDDMRRELERENWEEDAMNDLAAGPLHYESLREGENRELGVGYFSFSTNEEERSKQIEMLNIMREETKKEQLDQKRTKSKKDQALQARLDKIRQRKIKKLKDAGQEIPPELLQPKKIIKPDDVKTESDEEEKDIILIDDKQDMLARKFKVREWDKEKESNTLWTPAEANKMPKSWKDPREERLDEFAPPSFYYDSKTKVANVDCTAQSSHKHKTRSTEENKNNFETQPTDETRTNRLLQDLEQYNYD